MSPDKCQEKRRDKEDHEPNKSSTSDNEWKGKVMSGSEKDAKHVKIYYKYACYYQTNAKRRGGEIKRTVNQRNPPLVTMNGMVK